uniref:Uncharacterized protein n=1 Tax=Hyaloperonospora arabidopsidis (strain Emoy2) TaxID=559515 RepID=M4BMF8_HYAAE
MGFQGRVYGGKCVQKSRIGCDYSPTSAAGDILVLLQRLVGAADDFKFQGQRDGRGEFKR